jgi:hypothetical protein
MMGPQGWAWWEIIRPALALRLPWETGAWGLGVEHCTLCTVQSHHMLLLQKLGAMVSEVGAGHQV